jgi:hypothetical protein
MPGSYVIAIHGPGQPPQYRQFMQARVVIGREAGDILLPDAACSSTHAEVSFDGHTLKIRDLGSTNGTWLNGQRIGEIAWTPGSTLHIGAHKLTLEELRPAGPARGRTVAVNAVPVYSPPLGHGAPGAPGAPAHHPHPHAFARAPKAVKKGSSGALWVILGLLFAGTLGVGLIFLVALANRNERATNVVGGNAPM